MAASETIDASHPRTGRCQCGSVRFAVSGPIEKIYICHCTECRKQSAAAFGISAFVKSENFAVTEGSPVKWMRVADSGREVESHFCPTCGTRLWHQTAIEDGMRRVRGGSFEQALDVSGATHIFVSRKLPGIIIPANAVQHEGPER